MWLNETEAQYGVVTRGQTGCSQTLTIQVT